MRRRAYLEVAAWAAVVISMLVVLPSLAADEGAAAAPKPLEATLERMADLLTRLDTELAAVDRPAADRLGQRVEEAAGLVEQVLASLGDEGATPRQNVVRLDLTLHRLVALLEEIVGEPGNRPEQAKARMTLAELRAWVDGYVAAESAGMSPRDAERFNRAAHELARTLAAQLARVAKNAPATEPGSANLPAVVARLEALTLRLDELLLRHAARADEATP